MCRCAHCQSEGLHDVGLDCLWAPPERYALAQGASEDEAALFRECVTERTFQSEFGDVPQTAQAWKSFRADARWQDMLIPG